MIEFIKPQQVIERIRLIVPSLQNRVAGSGVIDGLVDSTAIQNLPTPSVIVVLADDSSITLSTGKGNLQQDILQAFDIYVILSPTDSRKQECEDQVTVFKEMLLYALNGWKPADISGCASYLEYTGSSLVLTSHSRYVRVFNFAHMSYFNAGSDKHKDVTLDMFDKFIGTLLPTGADEETEIGISVDNLYTDDE